MKSDSYGIFSRSRLFGRLSDARDQFAAAGGLAPDVAVAAATLDEKLLHRDVSGYIDTRMAPSVNLTAQETGTASDLETRIDLAPRVAMKSGEGMKQLRTLLAAAGVVGVLTVDSNEAGEMDARGATGSVWVPFHSAVVLRAAKPWDEGAVGVVIQQALRPHLSAGGLELEWAKVNRQGGAMRHWGRCARCRWLCAGTSCCLRTMRG
jgi:hypothetical protein